MGRTHGYMQSRDSRWRVCGKHTSKGACFALSAWWIIQTSHGASAGFWDWLGPSEYATGQYRKPDAVDPVREASNWRKYASRAGTVVTDVLTAMTNQSIALEAGDDMIALNTKLNAVGELIEANSGLRPQRVDQDVKAHFLPQFRSERDRNGQLMEWGTKLSKHRGYKYISISGLTMRAPPGQRAFQHGIAVFTGFDTYGIFDPNVGEFSSDTLAEFQRDWQSIGQHYNLTCNSANFALFQ